MAKIFIVDPSQSASRLLTALQERDYEVAHLKSEKNLWEYLAPTSSKVSKGDFFVINGDSFKDGGLELASRLFQIMPSVNLIDFSAHPQDKERGYGFSKIVIPKKPLDRGIEEICSKVSSIEGSRGKQRSLQLVY